MVKQGAMLYQGKAKTMYLTDQNDVLISAFRDDTSAFDGVKKAALKNKGQLNHQISTHIFKLLERSGVSTHYIDTLDATRMLIKRLDMLPMECVIRNRAAGSVCRRLGVEKGHIFSTPLFEYFYKDDQLHDPLVTEDHARAFSWATDWQMQQMRQLTYRINDILSALFSAADMILVDAKFEFGVTRQGLVCLGDEISPDSCRIWQKGSLESLDKDRFRHDMGNVMGSYALIAERILAMKE